MRKVSLKGRALPDTSPDRRPPDRRESRPEEYRASPGTAAAAGRAPRTSSSSAGPCFDTSSSLGRRAAARLLGPVGGAHGPVSDRTRLSPSHLRSRLSVNPSRLSVNPSRLCVDPSLLSLNPSLLSGRRLGCASSPSRLWRRRSMRSPAAAAPPQLPRRCRSASQPLRLANSSFMPLPRFKGQPDPGQSRRETLALLPGVKGRYSASGMG